MLIVKDDMAINLDQVLNLNVEGAKVVFYYGAVAEMEYDTWTFDNEKYARAVYAGIINAVKRGKKVFDCDVTEGV